MNQTYTIPHCIFSSSKLTGNEKLLWTLLYDNMPNKKKFDPICVGLKTLSKDLGISEKQTLKNLFSLERKNLIKLSKNIISGVIEYRIIDYSYFSWSSLEDFIK